MKKLGILLSNILLSGSILFSVFNPVVSISAEPRRSKETEEVDPNAWDGKIADNWTGTTINTPQELAAFADSVNKGNSFAGETITLNADINLNNLNWDPIGTSINPFSGIFDGNGKTISNLSIDVPTAAEGEYPPLDSGKQDNAGLFGFVKSQENQTASVQV